MYFFFTFKVKKETNSWQTAKDFAPSLLRRRPQQLLLSGQKNNLKWGNADKALASRRKTEAV